MAHSERPSWRDYCRVDKRRQYQDLSYGELTHSEIEAEGTKLLDEAGLLGEADDDEAPAYSEQQFHARERRRRKLGIVWQSQYEALHLEQDFISTAWCEIFGWCRTLRLEALEIDIIADRRHRMTFAEISETLGDPDRARMRLEVYALSPRQVRYIFGRSMGRIMREPYFGIFEVIAIENGLTTRRVINILLGR